MKNDRAKLLLEVLGISTKLGLTSFGGPIAHLGYFHNEDVKRRKWLDDRSYAEGILKMKQKNNSYRR